MSQNQPLSSNYKVPSSNEDAGYAYPINDAGEVIDLRPNSTASTTIINRLRERAALSMPFMTSLRQAMIPIEDKLRVRVQLSEKDIESKIKDSRKPIGITIPFMAAALETLLTYWTDALIGDPLFTYSGQAPEDTVGAKLLEVVIAQHARKSKMGLNIKIMARDALVYGFAPVFINWAKRERLALDVIGDLQQSAATGEVSPVNMQRKTRKVVDEYNVLENIDPLSYLPDPSVPIHAVQEGEFVGWTSITSRNKLISMEALSPESFFNCRYIPETGCKNGLNPAVPNRPNSAVYGMYDVTTAPVELLCMFVNLIPAQWGLGVSEIPEKWSFIIAGMEYIVQAKPLDDIHMMFPVSVCAPNFDGHNLLPTSSMELVYGIQTATDWLLNSRMADVMKCIEGGITIYNPDMINTADLLMPQPHKYVKMKNRGFNKSPAEAVYQVPTREVTTGHINDLSKLMDLGTNVTGASDTLQGVMKKVGERVTAEQISSTKASALNRIQHAVTIASIMAMSDIGHILACNVQQYMEDSQWFQTLGTWTDELVDEYGLSQKVKSGKVSVSPLDLIVDFDVVQKDASTLKNDNLEFLMAMIQMIGGSPTLSQQYDISRLVTHAARLAGVKNLNDFKITMIPPEQQMGGEQVGNPQ